MEGALRARALRGFREADRLDEASDQLSQDEACWSIDLQRHDFEVSLELEMNPSTTPE